MSGKGKIPHALLLFNAVIATAGGLALRRTGFPARTGAYTSGAS